ncbi:MAG: flagellar basal body-associated FliL family protein [Thiotrichales bacterium]|nr:flagellar basal body-associated FliL family protein [Thiotrichales bacterium]
MAEENENEETETEATEGAGSKKRKKLILIIAIVVVLLGGGGGAAFFFMGPGGGETVAAEGEEDEDAELDEEEDEESTARKDAFYFSLDPAFVVNFQSKSRARYLQVNIGGMTRMEETKLDVTKHLPQIRNNMVLMLSSQEYEVLMKPEGKDGLRKSLLKEINKILENETGKEDAVEDIYFTNFVMQ